MTGTELGQFVVHVYRVLKPIIEVANDAKDLAEDVGFSTSCDWDRGLGFDYR